MPTFVRASRRAKSYYRNTTSKLTRSSTMLKLPKVRLVESHAYQNFKVAQQRYNAVGGSKNFAKMQRAQLRHSRLTAIRKIRHPELR